MVLAGYVEYISSSKPTYEEFLVLMCQTVSFYMNKSFIHLYIYAL